MAGANQQQNQTTPIREDEIPEDYTGSRVQGDEIKIYLSGKLYKPIDIANLPTMSVEKRWSIKIVKTFAELAQTELNTLATCYLAVEINDDGTLVKDAKEEWYLALSDAIRFEKNGTRSTLVSYTKHVVTAQDGKDATKELMNFADIEVMSIISLQDGFKYTTNNKDKRFDINVFMAAILSLEGIDAVCQDYIATGGDRQLLRDATDIRKIPDLVIASDTDAETETRLGAEHYAKCKEIILDLWCSSKEARNDVLTTGTPTTAEMQFISTLLVLSSMKSFTDDTAHCRQYAMRRCAAFANHINSEDLTWDKVSPMINEEAIKDISRKLKFYPEFQRTLYCYIITSDKSWAAFCKPILEGSQVTTFNFIYVFLKEQPITKAHFHPQVIMEIKSFISKFEEAKRKYGSMIRFAKLIDPNDATLNATEWPYLASLALCSAYIHSKEASLFKYRLKAKIGSNVLKLLTYQVNDTYLEKELFTKEDSFMGLKDSILTQVNSPDTFVQIGDHCMNSIETYLTNSVNHKIFDRNA